MHKWFLYRTHQSDDGTKDRFHYLADRLKGMASAVWMYDGDAGGGADYGSGLPSGSSSFKNTDEGITRLWPEVCESYRACPEGTPRVFPKSGGPKRPLKWTLGHLPALEWWVAAGRPKGRFMVWEHDLWWDSPFDAASALMPAFSSRKFIAQPVKRYRPGADAIQPKTVNRPQWLKDSTICHYTATVMSDGLMTALEEVTRAGCWGHCELLVPSVANHHPLGGGAASWNVVAGHPALRPIIHRFEGQTPGKRPQRLFSR